MPFSVLFWSFAMELIWDYVSFSLTVNCCVVVEIYEIIIVWSYSCNGEIYTRKRLVFLAILLFWKIWFLWSCECTKFNILFNGEIIWNFVFCDHIELDILIVSGIVNSRVLVSFWHYKVHEVVSFLRIQLEKLAIV